MTTLGTANAEPGHIDIGRLEVGELRDGSPFGLPVAIINGASEGDTLYLQAGSDGDELNGIGVIRELVPRIDPAELTGTVLIVGIVNFHGYQVAEHRNPIDDTKLNRVYPGDPEGTSSERIANATYEIAVQADLVVDLHQGSTSRMIDETRVRCGRRHRLHDECLELARAFDTGFILDQKGPDGQLARAVSDEDIPAIDPELGGAVGWDDNSIATGVRGMNNILRTYGFLEGRHDPESQTRAAGFDRYNAPLGGLTRLEADLGDQLSRGDPLFTVTDVFGTERETVTAKAGGILWRTRRLPQVATGEYVCSVGTDIDEV